MRCGWQRRARRRLGYAVRGLLCAAVLAGCMAHRAAPLRIGMTPWPGNPFLYLAAAKGFFAAEGVQVQLVESGSLGDVLRAFERGEIDGIAGTLADVLEARERTRRKPRVFMALGTSAGTDVILARRTLDLGGIEPVADAPDEDEVFDVVALAAGVLARRATEAGAMVRAWDRTVAFAAENRTEAEAFMAERAGVGVQELHDALGGVTMHTSREQRALFAPDGALVAAVDALRTSGGGGDDGSAADCLAPELLARAGGRR